jgi:hypothetical protein
VIARLFRATPQREPDPRPLRSEANQQQRQGIIETAGQALERYEHACNACTRSSIRAICTPKRARGADVKLCAARCVIAIAVCLVAVLDQPPGASVTSDDSDDFTWVAQDIPATPLTLKRPASWADETHVRFPPTPIEAAHAQGKVVLALGLLSEPFDNLWVTKWSGSGAWYRSFGDFRRQSKAALESTGGRLLDAGMTKIAGMPAYWDIGSSEDVPGHPRFDAEIDVRTANHTSVSVSIDIATTTPRARQLVKNLIKDVHAKQSHGG